jgi:CRP/FNR family cyclic AMP-dependent transcriptional regulator
LLLTSGKETYKAGKVILREGSHGVAVYVVRSGKVEISKLVQGKKIVVETLGPGDMFGEMSYLDPAPRSVTAIALENTVLELLDKDFLDREFNQISSDFRAIICTLVRRLRKTTQNFVPSPRRGEERARIKIRISFEEVGDFFRASIGNVGNIGSGGLCIKTTKTLPLGTLLDLEFSLPKSNQIIRTKSKVVWIRSQDMSTAKLPPGMGTEFVDMDPEDKKLIEDCIASVRSP